MAAGEEEGRGRGRSEGGGGCEAPELTKAVSTNRNLSSIGIPLGKCQFSLLAKVDLLMPLAPYFRRSKHATGTALVTERSLTGTMRTAARDTGDTSHGATYSSP